MSNITKKIRKEMDDFEWTYNGILNTAYGSFVQSVCILHPEYAMDKFAFVRRFKKASQSAHRCPPEQRGRSSGCPECP